ncbi:CoF synthetase [Paenibacillus sp. V4I5]|uniref:CoF synthetase n=1 Tax=Paenibacillus sp. V4I5 TaxID=3042306 RepID=UPI00278ECDCF|nr:CoF synthetase [Paenibacillus sp. V4I5]MDQ0919046.1 phenylacetate-coenzyme A ligase PaaK-like adenylate-forming protein [Paenibacillus sp. V4I5]
MHIMETMQLMKRQFPWYLQGNDLEQSDEEWRGALAALPLMSAATLETFYYTDNNPFLQRSDLNLYRTSGTSSKRRKTIFYSESDEEAYLRIKLDIFRTILEGHKYRTAMADMGTGHAEATAVEVFRKLGMEAQSLSFQLPVEQHIERLASFRPEVLYTMPSILDRILLASDDPSAYGIRHVILVGEIAARGWIKRVAERLGIADEQITDTYGSIEIGTIAYFSHEHGRYLLAEGLMAEGVRAESLGEGLEPLADEQEQVLILTSTVRDSFPALRYVTYDVVRDLRPIMVDGVPRQSFQSIVKRIGTDLKHGEKISIYDIEDVVYHHLGNASVRVNVAGNSLRVFVYSPNATTAVLESIRFDVENRIPEIGMMIRARILEGIQVIGGTFDDSLSRTSVKNKKIFYT